MSQSTTEQQLGPAPTGSTIIKIATDLPVSGKDTSAGKPAENGAHLAVDQANANHSLAGYTLVFEPKDDVGPNGMHDPAVGARNVTAFVADALVAGIVGPLNSRVAMAELPITNQAPLAQISPATTNPCLSKELAEWECSGFTSLLPILRPMGKVTSFRIATTDDQQGPAGADFVLKTLQLKKVYVIDDADPYGMGLAHGFIKQFLANGGTVLGYSRQPGPITSYLELLTQIATLHPDAIYFGGIDATGGTVMRQQMQHVAGLEQLPFIGADGMMTPGFASTIGLAGGPVYATVAVVDTMSSASAASFNRQYDAVYGSANRTIYSALAYDCANILIQAIKTALANGAHPPQHSEDTALASAFRQAVITAIGGLSFHGVTGHHDFDSNGDTTNKLLSVYQLVANRHGRPDWVLATQVTVQVAGGALTMRPTGSVLEESTRAEVIEGVLSKLHASYVFPEVAQAMEQAIRRRASRGEYDTISSGPQLARLLTVHLQEVSHDKHLHVVYFAEPRPMREAGEPSPEEREEFRQFAALHNFGFEKVERLAGNIGYLDVRGFFPPEVASETAIAAMNFLANASALIIDLRQNGGGHPAMVAFLSSYLFTQPTHLNDLYWREGDRTEQYWTLPYVPGRRDQTRPVYILTSAHTVSGAEEFCYNLKNLKRATLIGETTGGAAHPGRGYPITEHFGVGIPTGRPINPITGTDWEGIGVLPDVEVPAEEAFKVAHITALKKVLSAAGENVTGPLKAAVEEARTTLAELEAASETQ
jgi:branched-chain amino acid transport system substrate-binding protein